MMKLIIHQKFIFKELPYIICDISGKLYQLPHCDNKRTQEAREIRPYMNNSCIGYRINKKYYSKNKLNSLAVKDIKIIELYVLKHIEN